MNWRVCECVHARVCVCVCVCVCMCLFVRAYVCLYISKLMFMCVCVCDLSMYGIFSVKPEWDKKGFIKFFVYTWFWH